MDSTTITDGNDDLWIFVSHSTKDFEKVRILRNMMEEIGMRPLLFYLKCLKDKPEVIELLKREIDVRPRFLLCDSKNSRESEYVCEEVNYIKSLNRQFVTVDLEDENQYMRKIQELKRRSHVFISYSSNDSAIMEEIAKELQSKGFIVQLAKNDLIPGRPYADEIKRVIYETLNKGYFIPLVSQSFINSWWCTGELEYALTIQEEFLDQRVIPIYLDKEYFKSSEKNIKSLFCDGTIEGVRQVACDIHWIDISKNS